ncbi:MAG: TetR/AcrR family transcriptional regulator [Gammaproteobacteria bacterium]|nr:TetR/AcrR family transcriptional regulator [Gammaproteobacteria bacterium]
MSIRASILEAGVALLRERGIAALTQPQVARAARVTQGHLTYYFPKRADLLLGIAGHSIDLVMADLALRLARGAPPAALAEALGAAMIAGAPPRLIIGLVVAADSDPEIRKRLRSLVKAIRRRISALLAQAGLAASPQTALLFHASIVGLAVLHQARLTAASAREVRDGMTALLRLLATSPGAEN